MASQNVFTDYAEEKALNAVFNDDTARPYKMALYTVTPTETTSGIEVDGTGYSRQTISFGAVAGSGDTPSKVTNNIVVTFGPATSGWGTVTGIAIFDKLGNMLVYGTLEASQTVAIGNKVEFAVGAVEISLD